MHWNKFIFFLVLAILSLQACKNTNSTSSTPTSAISYAEYEADWQEVKKLENKGMGKAIIDKSNAILEKALAENNINQVFKALAYRSKYSNHIEEESSLKILTAYEAQIEAAEFPLKQLLHSATGELYFQYYNQNRWRFRERTATTNFDEGDVRSWSLDQIMQKINQHYQASLSPKDDLSQFPSTSLIPILNATPQDSNLTKNNLELRPSLYDFLADRALQHYKRNEGNVNAPIHEFNLDDYAVFSSVENFIALELNSPDSNSANFNSLLVYQQLLKLHQNDKSPQVLIDFNLDRLSFAYNQSNLELKDSLYLKALQAFSKKHSANKSADEIDYAIAQLYYRWGNEYSFEEEGNSNQWYLKKAHEICTSKTGKTSFGAKQCAALKSIIEQTALDFQVENTYLPNEAILFRLSHKNIDTVYFRLLKLPHAINQKWSYKNREEFIRNLIDRKPSRTWLASIENLGDFQQHAHELSTQSLPKGNYFLLAANTESFDNSTERIVYANFQVSELAYMSRRHAKGNAVELYSLNRKTGDLLSNITVDVFSPFYDYSSRNDGLKKIATYETDKNAFVEIKNFSGNNQFQFQLSNETDTLGLSTSYYLYNHQANERTITTTHFFTDRAIYRPGQVVYFKGIVIESKGDNKTPKANFSTKVSLYNVNGEELSSLTVKTNDFGSYQGSFVLPTSGLNGQYRIQDKNGMHRFSVEEYKRPTFEIRLDSSKSEQKINKSIEVNGKVAAYSGAMITNAAVSYRIYRKASYPYWSYFRSFMPPANQKEIANGTISTDEKGAFTFNFLAQADPSIQPKWNPVYNYELVIDATSPSGETQSLTENIQLSSQSLFLTSDLGETIQFNDLKTLKITAQTINGQPIDTKASLSLWKLQTPKSPKKSKLWAAVDQVGIAQMEYRNNFPSYASKAEESELASFPRDYEVSNSTINCNKQLNLFRELSPGAYELVVETTDRYGEKVELKKRFNLIDTKADQPPYPLFSQFEVLKNEGEPGDTAQFIIGSSLKNCRLLYEVVHKNQVISKKWITLNNAQQKINIPIKEDYRGGFSIYFTGIHSDRMISYSSRISVPFSNKKLSLSLGTFRDKVQPGSQEKWTLSITGNNGDAAAAELLAGMYDQSLDQFRQDNWDLNLYRSNSSQLHWDQNNSFSSTSAETFVVTNKDLPVVPQRVYPSLNWFGFYLGYGGYGLHQPRMAESMIAGEVYYELESTAIEDDAGSFKFKQNEVQKDKKQSIEKQATANPIRSDFRETVFIYPQLRTGDSGEVSFEFTMPDALTQWKFRALAHTKNLEIGTLEQSIRTQKEIMVVPNAPRFFREGDQFQFTALINNLSDKKLEGYARLQFYNALNGNKIDIFSENAADIPFDVPTKGNTTVSWKVHIPKNLKVISYRIEAKTEAFSDGEERAIPVVPNRMLVTESLPLWIRGNESKRFEFKKLLNSASEATLSHESFTLEFTANPAWYAIQALPNLSEQTDECSEQVFARLYANSLAEKIANSNPKIKAVFEQWKNSSSEELTSKLMQNQELKSILLEETPWLKLAKSESEQKKRIALLFDYNRMAAEKQAAIDKLSQLQLPNGGWSWYKGMQDNRYISQYIVEGLGHLKKLGIELRADHKLEVLLRNAVAYMDQRVEEDYNRLLENKADLSKNHLGRLQIHYLYTRSFFQEISLPKNQKSYEYYVDQAQKYWLNRSIYEQGLIGLSMHRILPSSPISKQIQLSLADNAIMDEEMGMYWKNNQGGYYWYQAPIETQALMIELFEAGENQQLVEELNIWLLKQKQTQAWNNTKATAAACYALLMSGNNDFATTPQVDITIGNQKIELNTTNTEAGTGYYKKVWDAAAVQSNLGKIKVNKKDEGIAWGAAYWQFYQDLDEISNAKTAGLSLSKTIFKVSNSEKGEVMQPIDGTTIKVGDKIKVRIQLSTDRNLEFVHLKDMRAAAFEPVNVLSQYKYQDGLGYYESTKDASTNFFIDRLSKGVYVFEYALRASQIGEFSNGISTIQCQYAPEFASHSKGVRVNVVAN
ncbi:MAG: alpha-2-macroglobulin family protein [Vicingaceae bacterium]